METNLGMPYVYLIFLAVTARFTQQLRPRTEKVSLTRRIQEINVQKVREG